MGELQHEAFLLTFNGFLKVAIQGSHPTSEAALILVCDLHARRGLETLIAEQLKTEDIASRNRDQGGAAS